MLNQIINIVMRQIVRKGVNSAMQGGTKLLKDQMAKRSQPKPPAADPEPQPDPNAPDSDKR